MNKINANELLAGDHAEIEDAYEGFKNAGEERKAILANKIITELTVHAEVEEEIYYPELEAVGKNDLVAEFKTEHEEVKLMIEKLLLLDTDSPHYDSAMDEMMDAVLHHAKEEELEAFPMIENILGKEKLEEMGAVIEERKRELMKDVEDRLQGE